MMKGRLKGRLRDRLAARRKVAQPARYNHAYTIAFSLVSEHPEGEDVTAAMFSAALRKRADDLDATVTRSRPEGEWNEATGNPFDTYEED